jgi:hypothetical protein
MGGKSEKLCGFFRLSLQFGCSIEYERVRRRKVSRFIVGSQLEGFALAFGAKKKLKLDFSALTSEIEQRRLEYES